MVSNIGKLSAGKSFYVLIGLALVNCFFARRLPYLSPGMVPLWGWICLHKGIFHPEWYPYGDSFACIRVSFIRSIWLSQPIFAVFALANIHENIMAILGIRRTF